MRTVKSNTRPNLLQRLQGKLLVNVLVKELSDDSFEYVQLVLSPSSSVDAIIEAVEKVYVERIKEKNMNCLDSIRAKLAGVGKDYDDAVVIDVEFDSTLLWAELNLIIQELGQFLDVPKNPIHNFSGETNA